MRATRLQCTPRKCSRMHAPTTLLFASLLLNAWQNEVKLGGCLRFGLENFNGHSHYDGRPFGKHCSPRWILLSMEIGRILNTLLLYCCVWRMIDNDRIRYVKKNKKDKIRNLKENLRKSICKFEYVRRCIHFIRKVIVTSSSNLICKKKEETKKILFRNLIGYISNLYWFQISVSLNILLISMHKEKKEEIYFYWESL